MVIYKRLEEVCDILDSQRIPITASERTKGVYPYYGANGIQDYVDDYIFDDELVLLAEDGGNFGSTEKPIAYRVSGKCWVNNHAHVLKAKNIIDTDYLCLALMFYNTDGLVNGATRQKLTQKAMRSMIIPVRSREDQQRIKLIIQKVFSLIESHKKQIEKLDELIKSRFVEMFGDCKSNPYEWNTVLLEQIADVGSSKRVFVEDLKETGIPFYRGTEVGQLSEGKKIKPELYITREHYQELIKESGEPQKGDLLMPSICPDGRIWLVDTDMPFYFKDGRVLWVHNISNRFNSTFLLYTLKDRIMTDYLSVASGTTFAELKIFALKKCKVFDVPLDLQVSFEKFIISVNRQKATVQQSIDKLETLKKSLMQEYFG